MTILQVEIIVGAKNIGGDDAGECTPMLIVIRSEGIIPD